MRKPSPRKSHDEPVQPVVTLRERFGGRPASSESRVDEILSGVNPAVLLDAVRVVCAAGDCVMVAATRDGGAVVITILSGDDRKKFYPDDAQSFNAACTQTFDAYKPRAMRPIDVQRTQK